MTYNKLGIGLTDFDTIFLKEAFFDLRAYSHIDMDLVYKTEVFFVTANI